MPPRGTQLFWLMQKKKNLRSTTPQNLSHQICRHILPVHATPASLRSESNVRDPNGKEETSGPDLSHVTQRFPHYTPPLPPMAPKEEMNHWGRSMNSRRLTSKDRGGPAAVLCPLHQAPGPPLPQADGSYAAGPMQYVYHQFTTSDLLNW
jgi:hypothetical protein